MPGRFIAPDRSEWWLDLARPGTLEAHLASLPRTNPGELARLFKDRGLLAGVFEFVARTPGGQPAGHHFGTGKRNRYYIAAKSFCPRRGRR